jgi:hypothetical protein
MERSGHVLNAAETSLMGNLFEGQIAVGKHLLNPHDPRSPDLLMDRASYGPLESAFQR